MRPVFKKQFLSFFVCLLFNQFSANAQLSVSFSPDKTGGCSPLTVHFTNTSYASSSAVYKWDFGNGNTSALKDPGSVFLDKKSYTVTLTVTDGNQTSSASKTITVYQDPIVDFTSSLAKVCTPDPTVFSANASADNGSIVKYTWDFGDGYTQNSYQSQVAHSYMTAQDPTVRLTVTDNHGCTGTKTISKIIKVFNGVTAAFDADKTFICFQPDPVQMINQSQGEGPLNYTWDFGDGIQSAQKDPSHVFKTNGIYTVKLAIQNPNGCVDTLVKSSYLNVGNFSSQISVPDIICKNTYIEIKNTSTPNPTSYSFLVDGMKIYPDYYGRYNYTFNTAGEHTITLTNEFGGCEQSVIKKVDVKELPQPKGFIVDIPKYCFLPVNVNFQDTTAGVVKSEWNFFSYDPSTIQATGKSASYQLTFAGLWNITLFVTDSNGCRNTVSQAVKVDQPNVFIQTIDYSQVTCQSLVKKFKATSNVPIASYLWSFGDGTTSTDAEPEHSFTAGSYNVTLKYTTDQGCIGQTNPASVTVYGKPKADFNSISGTTICGDSRVTFINYSQNSVYDQWYINQQPVGGSGTLDYTFSDTGTYTVKLIASNPGCSDTLVKSDYIKVLPSFPQITLVSNTCEGDRGTVTFGQASRYAQKWIWEFGDGTSATYNSDESQITHHYTQPGRHTITLTIKNNGYRRSIRRR